jgi:glycosyltransferase
MKISVVMVCLNSEKTIAHAIGSFFEQSYANKELIIIDGGSQDATVQIVQSFSDEGLRLISESDDGIYDAMNKGLAAYSGDALGFLNSDDRFHDAQALERIADGLDDADAVYGDLIVVKDHAEKRPVRMWRAGGYRKGSFRWGWMPPHPTFYIRRGLADAVGPFDLRYDSAADYDYLVRALERENPRVNYIPHTLIDFMDGGVSTTGPRRWILANLYCLRSRQNHLGAGLIDLALFLKPLRKTLQFARRRD